MRKQRNRLTRMKWQLYDRRTRAVVPGFVCRNGRGYKLVCLPTEEIRHQAKLCSGTAWETASHDTITVTLKTIREVRAFLWRCGLTMIEPETG